MGIQRKFTWISTWTLLERPEKTPSRLYFETHGGVLRKMAFETAPPAPAHHRPSLPTPSSPHPESYLEDYLYTSASLNDIASIIPCIGKIVGKPAVIGLLLCDANGRESCVGQVRRDSLGCPLPVDPSQKLWLGFSLERNLPRVQIVKTSRPLHQEDLTWIDVPWTGTLEWWFSFRQCKVYHGNLSSPATRRDFDNWRS